MNNISEKQTLIHVEKLSKKFGKSLRRSLWLGAVDVFKSFFGFKIKSDQLRDGEFWSLQNINFELKQGDMLGIIGQNGSGKSTLLRILAGIYPPDTGSVIVKGRIGALISVGAGFHPHLSGLENIFLNATILGLTKNDIEKKLQDIIEFAEIGDFINSPVSTYSSGMTVRLGFSIAIHAVPEILLADEILAVGDLQFTLKCYRKLSEYRKNGGTIILVSHSLQQIRNFCNKALWLDKSVTKAYGDVKTVCDEFENFMISKDNLSVRGENLGNKIHNDPTAKITQVEFLNSRFEKVSSFISGESICVRIHYNCSRKILNPIFSVSLFNSENVQVISNFSHHDGFNKTEIFGQGYVDCTLSGVDLKPSSYFCTITFCENQDVNLIIDWHERSYSVVINNNSNIYFGLINNYPVWRFSERNT